MQSAASHSTDFNGDGYDDLAIGMPGDHGGRGAVIVLYGGPNLLSAAMHDLWTQDSPGMNESAEPGDEFGAALAVGNFDGDEYDDLAIGVPGEDTGTTVDRNEGLVHVLYGSAAGLTTQGAYKFGNGPSVPPGGGAGDHFGSVLAVGDFDDDPANSDDLVVGIPDADGVQSSPEGGVRIADSGVVLIMFGSDTGLSVTNYDTLLQSVPGEPESIPETEDRFGGALAVGDFNRDVYDDIAIAAYFEDIGSVQAAGAVTVHYGGPGGFHPTVDPAQFWHQDSPGMPNAAEFGDLFGARLAAGDFDGDSADDLAIGAPGEGIRTRLGLANRPSAGVVHVLYGSGKVTRGTGGLSTAGTQLWHQDMPGILDRVQGGEQFGDALAAGDFNGDGEDDLAIAASLDRVGAVQNAGVVHVLFGEFGSGLVRKGNQLWHQNRPAIPDVAEAGDNFGDTLTVGDFDASGLDELVIGVPLEALYGTANAGALHVIYNFGNPRFRFGSPQTVNQFWDSTSILGVGIDPGDIFAGALSLSRLGF